MIEINLIEQKQKMQLPILPGGIDLNYLNIKGLLLAWGVSLMLSAGLIGNRFENQIKAEQDKLNELTKILKDLQKKSRNKKKIEDAINKYVTQEVTLMARLEVVQKVIAQKKNPWKILHYTSLNIPEDVWLNELTLDDNQFTVKGEAKNYPAIGLFIDNLEKSVFFEAGQPTLRDSVTIVNKEYDQRTESFVLSGKIKRFD